MLFFFVRSAILLGQAVYWFLLRDDARDNVVWNACLYPGGRDGR